MFWPILPTLLSAATFVSSWTVPSFTPRNTSLSSFPTLIEVDLDQLKHGLEEGLFTSVDLVNAYIDRIREVNDTLHAVTELNPDALQIATQLDALRKAGTILSPLHGIPILIKNNIATADQMNNTAGSWSLVGAKVPRDSTIAAKLREAGAIILGKANLSQWANYRSLNTSNGWSAYGGQTYGAYYHKQDPSGSSAGPGVASSIGLALGSLGTETSGSILFPSDVNNLVGIKPTVGLTSRYLVIPISQHQDTIGPMTRYVKDAAYILQQIAGPDPRDNYTSAIPLPLPDYVAACDVNAFKGTRIGVARNVLEIWSQYTSPIVVSAFETAISQIEAAGATIVDANFTSFPAFQTSSAPTEVLNADFLVDLAKYFSELTYNPHTLTSLADERDFTHAFYPEHWPLRDTLIWRSALSQGWNNTSPIFWPAYQRNLFLGGEGGILGALERTNTTAVLLPTQISPTIPALVGSPVITVPMGFYPQETELVPNEFGDLFEVGPGLPFGLSFMGRRWSEDVLIGLAFAFEQMTMHRNQRQPYIVPTTELSDVVGRL